MNVVANFTLEIVKNEEWRILKDTKVLFLQFNQQNFKSQVKMRSCVIKLQELMIINITGRSQSMN